MNWIVVGNVGNGLFGDKGFFGIIEMIIYIWLFKLDIHLKFAFIFCFYLLILELNLYKL